MKELSYILHVYRHLVFLLIQQGKSGPVGTETIDSAQEVNLFQSTATFSQL